MTKRFADISVGTVFNHEGKQYKKIADQRISCCKVLNAELSNDSTKKTFIVPVTEVEIVE